MINLKIIEVLKMERYTMRSKIPKRVLQIIRSGFTYAFVR